MPKNRAEFGRRLAADSRKSRRDKPRNPRRAIRAKPCTRAGNFVAESLSRASRVRRPDRNSRRSRGGQQRAMTASYTIQSSRHRDAA